VIEYRILGPLEVHRDGEEIDLGGRNQRAVLALLLLQANRVVSIERLAEDLYAGAPPVTAVTQVHRQVSELRKVLEPAALETRPPGYLVRVADGALDLQAFEQLSAKALQALDADDPAGALDASREALDLWRGPPLGDLAYEQFAQGPIERLEELRLAAVEHALEAELALGHFPEAVAELRDLVVSHPLRERFRELLMRALYGAGRQVEALQVYREARDELLGAYGIEPGPALRDLEGAILRQDPELGSGPPPSTGALLVVGRNPARLGELVAVAEALARTPDRELVAMLIVEDEADLPAATAVLPQARERLGPRGRAATFASTQVGDDILRLARSHDPALVLIDADQADLNRDGSLIPVLERTPVDVAAVFMPAAPAPPGGGVILPFAGGEHDWAAVELAAWLALATGERLLLAGGHAAGRVLADASVAVQRLVGLAAEPLLVDASADALPAVVAGATAVVIGLSPRWQSEGLGEARSGLVADPACPVFVVHRGPRPGGIAPREAATRFTWSIAGS
jgi:DNA-binding SARP family transcriptional activator